MPRYVNVGCGWGVGESWENYDASPTLRFERLPLLGRLYTRNAERFPGTARYADISRGPIGDEGSADAIFCSHMLEHVPLEDMRASLRNMFRMLKAGGLFRMIVPDLAIRAHAYTRNNGHPDAAGKFVDGCMFGVKASNTSLLARVRAALGNSKHLQMYDEAAMRKEMARAGFVDIRRCAFGDSELAAFAEVEDPARFECEHGSELALESRKP